MFTRSIPRSALLLSGCVGVALAFLGFTGLAQQNKKDEPKPKETVAGQICICPVAKMFQHSGYCTYYALKCNDAAMLGPCPWDGSCDSTSLTNGCGCTNCIPSAMIVGTRIKAAAAGLKSGGSEDALKKGGYEKNSGKPKHKHDKDPKVSTDTAGVAGKRTLLGHFTIRYPLVSDPDVKVAAQVFAFSFFPDDPTAVPPGIITVGHEIELKNGDPAPLEVTKEGVAVLGDHCHEVTINGVAYQIMTHWETAADPVSVPVPVP